MAELSLNIDVSQFNAAAENRVTAPKDEVLVSSFWPLLSVVICMLSGAYNLSRRQVVVAIWELFHIRVSLGSVSNIEGAMSRVLAPASAEAMAEVQNAVVKYVDETSWIRDSACASAWIFASALVSVFRITPNGKRETLRNTLTESIGVLVSDRVAIFLYWSIGNRQICWSHLLRTFTDYSEREGPVIGANSEQANCQRKSTVIIFWHCKVA